MLATSRSGIRGGAALASGTIAGMSERLEFWPEYRGGPLWTTAGQSVDLADLPISDDLRDRVAVWSSKYGDEKLPTEGPGDPEWIADGRGLLAELRSAVRPDYEVIVTEPWWAEEPG
jgi:hypothetical protein